jgi:serine/threonine protein kinase
MPREISVQELVHKHLALPQQPDELGRLGPYRILKMLGEGGMGVVFQAEDPALERMVALKVMKPDGAAAHVARQRFLQEARAAGSIQHEHIVTIYQVGEDRDMPYLAMQLLHGEPLDVRLKREGRLPVGSALVIAREVAEGLAAAHNHNLIHRDIKPANIWLEDAGAGRPERAKILDFGLARLQRDDAQHLTRTGLVIGTPGYMAPEQARTGQPLDGRCDLFSLGCVLYHMLTGQEPFRRDDAMATLLALALEEPAPIRHLNPEVPPSLVRFVSGLLAKNPDKRPHSAGEAIERLEDLEREWRIARPCKVSSASPSFDLPSPAADKLAEFGVTPAGDSTILATPAASAGTGTAFLDMPPRGQPSTAPLEPPGSEALADPKPAATRNVKCPRCHAPGLNPAGRAWCVACGYYPEPEKKDTGRSGRLDWLWVPLIGTVAVILVSYAAWIYLPRIGFHPSAGRSHTPPPAHPPAKR